MYIYPALIWLSVGELQLVLTLSDQGLRKSGDLPGRRRLSYRDSPLDYRWNDVGQISQSCKGIRAAQDKHSRHLYYSNGYSGSSAVNPIKTRVVYTRFEFRFFPSKSSEKSVTPPDRRVRVRAYKIWALCLFDPQGLRPRVQTRRLGLIDTTDKFETSDKLRGHVTARSSSNRQQVGYEIHSNIYEFTSHLF